MNRSANGVMARGLLLAGIAAMMLTTVGCNKLRARGELNQGVQAYKASRFEQAENHFQNAIHLDPSLSVAKLYLATACFSQYVPGSDDETNKRKAQCAIDLYQEVLQTDPKNILSLKGLASIYYNMKKFEEAKQWDKKAIETDPNDPENYYSAAVIDWFQTYEPRMKARQEAGITRAEDPMIKNKKLCEDVKSKNQEKVEEGITLLNKALDLRKDYEDAMSYLNLMYRERADIQCGDDDARKADLAKADELVQRVMDVKKEKIEKAGQQHGIVLDQPKQ